MSKAGYSIGPMSLLTQHIENKRSNKFWTLIYVRRGAGMYLIDKRLTCLNESDILFLPPNISFSFDSKELGDEYNESIDAVIFRFNENWIDSFINVFHTYRYTGMALKGMREAVSIYGPKWLRTSSILNELMSCDSHREAAIILELLSLLSDSKDTMAITSIAGNETYDIKEKIERIDRFISCNLLNGFSLEEIADYVGMNRTYFCLFFKKHYKAGLIEYVNSQKVEKACVMLKKTDLSVADISRECGFTNIPYFNRVFKSLKGISPREYRNAR